LTGRKYEYHLLPISFEEMVQGDGLLEERRSSERDVLKYLSADPGSETRVITADNDGGNLYKKCMMK